MDSASAPFSGQNAIHFVDSSTGYIAGVFGYIYKTTDAGATWTPMPTGSTIDLFTVKFVTPDHGWTGGDGNEILETTDGGLTWSTTIIPSLIEVGNFSMQTINSGWMAEHGGGIYKFAGTTSVAEATAKKTFSAYPNPASDYFTIRAADEVAGFTIEIYDVTGRTVAEKMTTTNEIILSV